MKMLRKDIQITRSSWISISLAKRVYYTEVAHAQTGLTAYCSDEVSASQQRFRALLALSRMLRQEE